MSTSFYKMRGMLLLALAAICSSFAAFAQGENVPQTGPAGQDGYQSVNGVAYKIVEHGTGRKINIGDVITMQMVMKAGDQVLMDTRQIGKPVPQPVDTARLGGDFQAVMPLLSQGDSVDIRVSCDTIMKYVPAPGQSTPWMKSGNFITVNIRVVSVSTKEEFEKEAKARADEEARIKAEKDARQMPVDDKKLKDYFAKNHIKAQKASSGLYYTITKPGKGNNAKPGNLVSVKYIGRTMDGKQFDANVDKDFNQLKDRDLIAFPIGKGHVIKGWEEGVQVMNTGCRATLYIPSPLAYGDRKVSDDLPENSILIFDLEITEIKAD